MNELNTLFTIFESTQYKLVEKIGEGGFASVYNAIHSNTGQEVAIKILTLGDDFSSDKRARYIERFNRETELVSFLNHPNIVKLLDKGFLEDTTFFAVFEMAQGQTLRHILDQNGALSTVESADIMSQVLSGLVHAHNKGVVHRDIKPSNIIICRDGSQRHVKILDFGISALVKEARQQDYKNLTLTQEMLGTPAYCAPEQLRGEPPTPKSDLYVWGLVLIECLTGTPAITGQNLASIFHKQLSHENIPLPAAITSHPLGSLLREILHKQESKRLGSTEDIYNKFCKLNFSGLVGNIQPNNPVLEKLFDPNHISNTHPSLDETLISKAASGLSRTIRVASKQITVMSVTLTIKAVHNESTDPEVINAFHKDQKTFCVDTAVRYGAVHAGTLADTVLFYFGWPIASDNDARLSARAALELTSAINKRNALLTKEQGVYSEVRIGVNSGAIIIYEDATPEGNTINIAMELARKALPNTILCSANTRMITENYCEFEPALPAIIGTSIEPTPLYVLTGEKINEAFGFLREHHRHQNFVGREYEIEHLTHVIDSGKFKFCHIYGDAGIGKSRIIFELRNKTVAYRQLIAQCLPEYENNALYPFVTLLKRQYFLDSHNEPDAVEILKQALEVKKVSINNTLPILCAWLNLPCPEGINIHAGSQHEIKINLFSSLALLLFNEGTPQINEKKPQQTMLIVEDLHWADPTSKEFVAYLLHHPICQQQSNAVLTTSRYKLPPTLSEFSERELHIQKLTDQQSVDLVACLFEREPIEPALLHLIISRTDGIPLFIEELILMLNHKQLIHRINGVYSFTDPNKTKEVPNSLRESLQQNLDKLKIAKSLVQHASAIGREFSYSLLLNSTSIEEADIQLQLQELVDNELIYRQRKTDGDSYLFKHALVRETSYESMLPSDKKLTHKKIAETLSNSLSDRDPSVSGLLAMHWEKAGKYENAIECANAAVEFALKRTAASEAIEQALKVQTLLPHLDGDKQVDAQLKVYSFLTSAYMETKGWASEEVLQYSQASLDLLAKTERYDELVSHLWWKVINGVVSGRRAGLESLSKEMDKLLNKTSLINQAAIKCAQGFYRFTDGDRNRCIGLLEASINLYDTRADRSHQQTFGFDVNVFAKATLARAYADQGKKDDALATSRSALDEAKSYDHVPSIGISLMYYGLVHQQYNNRTEVEQSSSELLMIADKYQLPIYKGFAQMLFDWSQNDTSNADTILKTLKDAGSRHGLGHFQSFFADIHAQNQQYSSAIQKINECLDLDRSINEGNYLAYLLYKKASYLFASEDIDNSFSEKVLSEAMTLAESQAVSYVYNKCLMLMSHDHIGVEP